MARAEVPLYIGSQRAGQLPVRTVVEAEPAADTNWLRLYHQGRRYEAASAGFWSERDLLKDLADYEISIRDRYQALAGDFDRLQERKKQLEHEAARCETSGDSLTVVIPPPAPLLPAADPAPTSDLVLVTRSPGPGRAAICRREIRRLDRQMEKLEQRLAGLELEGQRIADIRSSLTRRFTDFRLAGQTP